MDWIKPVFSSGSVVAGNDLNTPGKSNSDSFCKKDINNLSQLSLKNETSNELACSPETNIYSGTPQKSKLNKRIVTFSPLDSKRKLERVKRGKKMRKASNRSLRLLDVSSDEDVSGLSFMSDSSFNTSMIDNEVSQNTTSRPATPQSHYSLPTAAIFSEAISPVLPISDERQTDFREVSPDLVESYKSRKLLVEHKKEEIIKEAIEIPDTFVSLENAENSIPEMFTSREVSCDKPNNLEMYVSNSLCPRNSADDFEIVCSSQISTVSTTKTDENEGLVFQIDDNSQTENHHYRLTQEIDDQSQNASQMKYSEINIINESTTVEFEGNVGVKVPPDKPLVLHAAKEEDNLSIRSQDSIVNPSRRPKPGSLLEKFWKVKNRVNSETVLFKYEKEAGLKRYDEGEFSDPLIVNDTWMEGRWLMCSVSLQQKTVIDPNILRDIHENESLVEDELIIAVSKKENGLLVGSVVVIYLPVEAFVDSNLKVIIVFVNNRIEVVGAQEVDQSKHSANSKGVLEVTNDNCLFIFGEERVDQYSLVRNLSFRDKFTILDAAVGHLLFSYLTITLLVLHVFWEPNLHGWKSMKILTADNEGTYCQIELNCEKDFEKIVDITDGKLIALKGNLCRFTGMVLTKRAPVHKLDHIPGAGGYIRVEESRCQYLYSISPSKDSWSVEMIVKNSSDVPTS